MPEDHRNSLSWITARRRLAVLFVLFSFALAAGAVRPIPYKHSDKYHQVERLEESWRTAMMAGDIDTLSHLLADDYIAISANGTLESKEQALAALKAGNLHLTSMEISDRKIRFYGSTAVVTSLSGIEGHNAEGPVSGEFRYTRVYVRNAQGEWKIVSFEISRIHPHGMHHSNE